MQALKIKKKIDSDILYLPEIKNMIGKNVEIVILLEPEKISEDTYDSLFSDESICKKASDFFMSGTDQENRRLLQSINAAYADGMQDAEELMLLGKMRCRHRHLIMENEQW